MRLSMFTMLWQQRELKAWLQSNSFIVPKLTFGSDVMSAYSSLEKHLANSHGYQIGNVVTKSGPKNFDLTDSLNSIGDHQDVHKVSNVETSQTDFWRLQTHKLYSS